MPSIQVVSDLHAEHGPTLGKIRAAAEVLVLAGDIGSLKELPGIFADAAARWDQVVYVAGNHEYYDNEIDDTNQAIAALADRHPNVHFLNNGVVVIDHQRFVGTTLWSSPHDPTPFHCFKRIKNMTKERWAEMNAAAKRFLVEEVQEDDVVVTHFMPLMTKDAIEAGHRHPIYYPNPNVDDYYGNTGLRDTLEKALVWVSGHTHDAFSVKVGDCMWVCNPLGCPGERCGGDPNGLVMIEA